MSLPGKIHSEIFSERGYTCQVETIEEENFWTIEVRIGVYEGDRLIDRADPLRRKFFKISEHEALLNNLIKMEREARAIVATLPPLD